MIMAAQDQALRTNLASKMCLQSIGCAEKLIRQLAILYRNSRNFLTSNIDIGGTTRWRRWFSGTYVESWVMTEMKNSTTSWVTSTTNKLQWDFKIHTTQHSKYNQHNKTDMVVLNMIERKFLIIDVACPFQILVKDRDREYWVLPNGSGNCAE